MKENIFIFLGLCCLFGSLVWCPHFLGFYEHSPFQIGAVSHQGFLFSWYPSIHKSYNAYMLWGKSSVSGIFNSIVFFLNTSILFYYLSKKSWLSTCTAFLCLMLIATIYRGDSFILDLLAWCPLLILATTNSLHQSFSFYSLAFLGLTSMLVSFSSSFLAPLICALAYSSGYFLRPVSPSQKTIVTAIIFCFLPPVLILTLDQGWAKIPFPDYPPQAHLVPDDGISGYARPLIGPHLPLPVINRVAVRGDLGIYSLMVFLLPILTLGVYKFRLPKEQKNITFFSLFLVLCVILDTLAPERISHIAPLAALNRMVPGLFLFPLSPVIIGVALLLVFIPFLFEKTWRLYLALLLLFSYHAFFHPPPSSTEAEPKIMVSPSYYALSYFGPWILEHRLKIQQAHFLSLDPFTVQTTTSHQNTPKSVKRLTDGKFKLRWSPGRGYQKGDEWILLSFTTPQIWAGLELVTGKYYSDFPQGLRVSSRKDCVPSSGKYPNQKQNYKVIADYPSWQGELKFTPLGYPYFGGQDKVKIYFHEPVETCALLIEQTGENNSLDWSVTEILKFGH